MLVCNSLVWWCTLILLSFNVIHILASSSPATSQESTDQATPDKLFNRFQYHQQGLNGAHHVSYRFGFESQDRQNPLSRHEVSLGPGHVTGAYSFMDPNNKLQIVEYESDPKLGFRIVKQWTQERDQ